MLYCYTLKTQECSVIITASCDVTLFTETGERKEQGYIYRICYINLVIWLFFFLFFTLHLFLRIQVILCNFFFASDLQLWNVSSGSFLVSTVSHEKSAVNIIWGSLYIMSLFSLSTFKVLFGLLLFYCDMSGCRSPCIAFILLGVGWASWMFRLMLFYWIWDGVHHLLFTYLYFSFPLSFFSFFMLDFLIQGDIADLDKELGKRKPCLFGHTHPEWNFWCVCCVCVWYTQSSKIKTCWTKILYPTKCSFKTVDKINTFIDKWKLRELLIDQPDRNVVSCEWRELLTVIHTGRGLLRGVSHGSSVGDAHCRGSLWDLADFLEWLGLPLLCVLRVISRDFRHC